MVLAPSLPIQCKQIHEAPSVLSPVQIKSTGMRRRRRRREGGGGGGVHRYSTALYLTSNPKSFFFYLRSLTRHGGPTSTQDIQFNPVIVRVRVEGEASTCYLQRRTCVFARIVTCFSRLCAGNPKGQRIEVQTFTKESGQFFFLGGGALNAHLNT